MLVKEILEIEGAKLINGSQRNKIDSFTINTNELKGKTMFFPLKGNTNGHNYILNGVKNKLAGFFVEKGHEDIIEKAIKQNSKIIIIEVEDCKKALIELAKIVRNKLDIPVIALTGSYGKTSQREMIYSVLKTKYNVLVTQKNYNNNIGMPLTLVNYNNEDVILLELGSNHMGEIKVLREICRPTITLITNIGTAHIGNFKNIKNTAKEKGSITVGSEYFFQNEDDNLIKKVKAKGSKVIPYSIEETTNIIKGKKNRYTYTVNGKRYKITINSDLEYLITYSLCALKIGLLLDIDMPKLNGVDLAVEAKNINKDIDIIFISNREDKVFETFKVLPFGFVRKTSFSKDIVGVLQLYMEKRIMTDTYIAIKSNNNSVIQKVNVNSIVYIESFRYKQFVYLENGDVIECRMTLEDFESKLAKNDIIKVYKGYLINLKFVQKIENRGIIMNYKDGVLINISRSKVQEIKTIYLNYLRKTGTIVFNENE